MDASEVKNAYKRYAPVYDLVFGGILSPGRRAAIEILNDAPGKRLLEVGVGTGLSLPYYRKDKKIWGIDLSTDMLKKASRRIERKKLSNVHLMEMDAENLKFEDNEFDGIALIHTLSAVPNPEQVLRECMRVVRSGSPIVICNHFQSSRRWLAKFEKSLSPAAGLLGWEPAHPIPDQESFPGLEILDQKRINAGGYWKLLHCQVNKPDLH